MKKFRILMIALAAAVGLASFGARAEINIGVAIPDKTDLSEKTLRILDSRLKKAITSCGVSSTQWGDFFLIPTITVVEENITETGMVKIFQIQIDMTLSIEQLDTGSNYGSETWTLKGTGDTRAEALVNAFANWRGDSRFTAYIADSKKNIEEYFITNRTALLAKASQKANAGEYDAALAILSSYPTNLPGADEVIGEMNDIYFKMLSKECGTAIQKARSMLATGDYEGATAVLAFIRPDSPCIGEAREMQNTITQRMKADDEQAYARQQADLDRQDRRENEAANRNERLEKARLDAVTEVAKAYYNRQNNVYHYHIW